MTVTKYRADILTGERLEHVAEVAHEIAEDLKADIKNVDGGTDHVHIMFTTKPTTDLMKFINSLNGVTSRRIRQEYPEMKQTLEDAFWQPGYFLATTGQVSINALMDYVENQ